MFSARRLSAVLCTLAVCAVAAPAAQASWTAATGTVPSNTSQAFGVTCVTSTNCLLAGAQSGGTSSGLAQKWNGTSLSTVTTASTTSELYGVGCNSATFCVAVGTDYAGGGAVAHAESYNGTSFSNMTTVNPAGSTFTQLAGVGCPGATSCFAVGHYISSGVSQPVIERWNGSTWAQQTPTLPVGTTSGELDDVSCTSTTVCTAVGYYVTSGNKLPLALRWNGTSWSSQTTINPSGATGAQLQGVSCTASNACHAVGFYLDSLSVQHSLAEVWTTSWAQKTVPDPAGGTDTALSDISCYTSASAGCIAVGGYTGSGGNVEPLIEGYNGTSWSVQSVSRPSDVSDASLAGVSCTSSTTCLTGGLGLHDGSLGVTGVRPQVYKGP